MYPIRLCHLSHDLNLFNCREICSRCYLEKYNDWPWVYSVKSTKYFLWKKNIEFCSRRLNLAFTLTDPLGIIIFLSIITVVNYTSPWQLIIHKTRMWLTVQELSASLKGHVDAPNVCAAHFAQNFVLAQRLRETTMRNWPQFLIWEIKLIGITNDANLYMIIGVAQQIWLIIIKFWPHFWNLQYYLLGRPKSQASVIAIGQMDR